MSLPGKEEEICKHHIQPSYKMVSRRLPLLSFHTIRPLSEDLEISSALTHKKTKISACYAISEVG